MLGMHMANELLNIPVAGASLLAAGVAVAIAARRCRNISSTKAPLMGVMGAFVFAAQMINFTLPGMPGTSGHLGGGVLLSILLGPSTAIVTMAAILIVQCLLFQDGGLLALGCNIINMAVIPSIVGWGIFQLTGGFKPNVPAWRQYLSAWLASVAGVAGGAAMVPLEAAAAGVLLIPAGQFLAVVIAVHLIIGLIEGAITFAVLAFLRRSRPDLLGLNEQENSERSSTLGAKPVAATILLTALLLAGVASWFASSYPDGLEWSYQHHKYQHGSNTVATPSQPISAIDQWQAKWSLMSDYEKRTAPLGQAASQPDPQDNTGFGNVNGWRSLAGISGTIVTLAILYLISRKLNPRLKVQQ